MITQYRFEQLSFGWLDRWILPVRGGVSRASFSATRVSPPSTIGSSQKAFNKLDKDDGGEISAEEWGVEITG